MGITYDRNSSQESDNVLRRKIEGILVLLLSLFSLLYVPIPEEISKILLWCVIAGNIALVYYIFLSPCICKNCNWRGLRNCSSCDGSGRIRPWTHKMQISNRELAFLETHTTANLIINKLGVNNYANIGRVSINLQVKDYFFNKLRGDATIEADLKERNSTGNVLAEPVIIKLNSISDIVKHHGASPTKDDFYLEGKCENLEEGEACDRCDKSGRIKCYNCNGRKILF
jgi:hypothetical protein